MAKNSKIYIQNKKMHPFIKFDSNHLKTKQIFLDFTIKKITFRKTVNNTLYRKQTARQSYRHQKSEHPESLKRSFPLLQLLQLKQISTTLVNYIANVLFQP